MSLLPLRLLAEPIARETLGHCFVLPSKDEDAVVLIISESGLLAIASNRKYENSELCQLIDCPATCLPEFHIVFATEGTCWYTGNDKINARSIHTDRSPSSSSQCACTSHHNCVIPQRIVEGIERYYSRQVLEPAVRGFLSILEKQFPRNDLYLFELLQNAVDDGASIVRFSGKNTREQCGLQFSHNGRGFNALDVIGLASVGLSTKGANTDEPKRTIGFMGVGFKAVYKRYSKVTVYDDRYCFGFQEFGSTHGWVLQPKWKGDDKRKLWSHDQTGWCHFQLENPRGGIDTALADLKTLPRSVPALLGRQSIKSASLRRANSESLPIEDSWQLEWDRRVHTVSCAQRSTQVHAQPFRNSDAWITDYEKMQVRVVEESRPPVDQHWQFITVKYEPTATALSAYSTHTKRSWNGEKVNGISFEETCIFFELDAGGCPISSRGTVHSVLPTKLTLPCNVQWQGSWLLSVDRQDVQNVVDNDWNACILRQAARLFASLLQWAAFSSSNNLTAQFEKVLRASYALLPPMKVSADNGRLYSILLGESVSMHDLKEYVQTNDVVPTRAINNEVKFTRSSKVVWLPPPLLSLPISTLERWFKHSIFAADILCDATCWLPLWKSCLQLPTMDSLASNRSAFSPLFDTIKKSTGGGLSSNDQTVSDQMTKETLAVMSAFGQVLDIDVTKWTAPANMANKAAAAIATEASTKSLPAKSSKGHHVVGKYNDADESRQQKELSSKSNTTLPNIGALCDDWLPHLEYWPIFPSSNGSACVASKIVWVDFESFGALPGHIRSLLRTGVSLAGTSTCNTNMSSRSSNQKHVADKKVLQLLDAAVEDTLLTGFYPSGDVVEDSTLIYARNLAKTARSIVLPGQIITAEVACRALLKHWASNPSQSTKGVPDVVAKQVEDIFRWALTAAKPEAISHILITPSAPSMSLQTNALLHLVPTASAYLGSAFIGEDGRVLEQLSNQRLSFVATCYLPENQSILANKDVATVKSAMTVNRVADFLIQCGVNRGPAMEATARVLTEGEVRGQAAIKLRQSNSSCLLHLPYNLGPFTRKHVYEVNILLSSEWARMLNSDLSVADASSLVGIFASLLAACDCANPASAESTPAAANLFQGKGINEAAILSSSIESPQRISTTRQPPPGLSRLFWLPPGQPGASSLPLRPATWIQSLADSRWIPAIPAGAPMDSPATQVLRPREVQLPTGLPSGDIPVAKVSTSVVNLLVSVPAVLKDLMAWGTQKPKPPIEKLEQIAADLDKYGETIPVGKLSDYYNELVGIWRIICIAQSENRLSTADIRRICNVCSGSITAAARCIIPGTNSGTLFPFNRCVAIDPIDRAGTEVETEYCNDKDKQFAAAALAQVDYLLNFNAKDSQSSWPLTDVSKHLRSILRPSSGATQRHGIDFFVVIFDKLSPVVTPDIRRAFSWALWLAIQVEPQIKNLSSTLQSDKRSNDSSNSRPKCWAAAEITAAQKALQAAIPRLRLHCRRGLDLYPDLFPSQWLPAYKSARAASLPSPVLIDDMNLINKSGHNCGSMLLPKHGFQPIAVLNHGACTPAGSYLTSAELTRLVHVDSILLQVLDIPRTSDTKQFSLKVSVFGTPQTLVEPTQRLQAVVLILQLQCKFESMGNRGNAPNKFWSAPKLVKYKSLNLQFTTPKSESTAKDSSNKIVVSAIWGPVCEGAKPLFVAGDADDYAAEVEELILSALSHHHFQQPQQQQPSLQWPAKVLRLLHHLEDGEKFMKFLQRDFSPFFPQEVEDRLTSGDTPSDRSGDGSGSSSREDAFNGMTLQTLLRESISKLLELQRQKEQEVEDAKQSDTTLYYRCPECNQEFSKWKKCHDHITMKMHNSYKAGQVLKPTDYCHRVAVNKVASIFDVDVQEVQAANTSVAEQFLSTLAVRDSTQEGQALVAWAMGGVGKKLSEKFGFSQEDLAVGPIGLSVVQLRQGLGFNNKSMGRGRALVLPAWMTIPGGKESAEMMAESELLRLQQSAETEAYGGGDVLCKNNSDTTPVGGQGLDSSREQGRSQVFPAWMATVGDTGAVVDSGKGELLPISLPVCQDEVQGQAISSGRGRSRVLPAWMTVPGSHEEDAMEVKKRRLVEIDQDSSSTALHQFEDAITPVTVLNDSILTTTSSTNQGAKRKASLMESESEVKRAQAMRAMQEQLSAFLAELWKRVDGGDISRDWAKELLIEAMRSSSASVCDNDRI